MLGTFHFELGEKDEALARYEAALALAPESLDVREHRAEWEGRHGDPADADRRYAGILAEVRRPDLLATWGELLLSMPGREADGRARLVEAERLWREALAAGDIGVRRALARHLLDHGGDPEEALALARSDLESRQDRAAHDLVQEAEARTKTRPPR
jgi:tetratricopeptide (TPR) repeat protein